MNKSDLASELSKKLDLTQVKATACLEMIFESIAKALSKGEGFSLVGFGTFSVKKRAARVCRNPRTGEMLKIPAKKVVHFSVGKSLKEKVNKK